jgi:polar amino acid transport system substrate-binding protein
MRCAAPLKSALIALLLATPLATHAAAAKCDRLIATGAASNPPFLWRDPQNPKRLVGANADLLKQITDALDLKLEVLYTGDSAEALDQVRSGRVDVLADAVLDSKKLAFLDFVYPSITPLQVSAWVGQDPGFLYANREDLVGHSGTYVEPQRFDRAFAPFAKENLSLRASPNLTGGLRSLLAGKTDYVLHERYSTIAHAARQGLLADIQRLEPPVSTRDMHFALAHDSACNGPWLRGQLAIKMTELRAAGVPQQLLADNIERWKQRPAATSDSQR